MNAQTKVLEQIAGNRHGGATQIFFAPSALLRGLISHYTVQLSHADTHAQNGPLTIVPDASGCLIITVKDGVANRGFWGPSSTTHQVTRDFNAITLRLLVEFLPGGAFGLFGGLPLHELHNSQDSLDSIAPSLDRIFAVLAEQHHASYPALLQAVDAVLVRHLGTVREHSLLRHVLANTSTASGTIRLSTLSAMTSYSIRHINRLCQERIGLSYKSFARILRINKVCHRMNHGATDLLTLAHDLDFYDQAHFSKDFKDICGVTPSDYQRNMSHFYNEETKLCCNLPDRYTTSTLL